MKKELPDIIREIRDSMSMGQKEFGLKVFPDITENAAQNKIKRFESGVQEPVLSEIISLAKAMNVSISYLFGEDETKSKFDPAIMPILEDAYFILRHGSDAQKTALISNIHVLLEATKERLDAKGKIDRLTRENQYLKNFSGGVAIDAPPMTTKLPNAACMPM